MAIHHLLFAIAYVGLVLSIWVFIAKEMDLKMARLLEFLRGVIIKAVALLLAIGWAASVINAPHQKAESAGSAIRDAVHGLRGADKNLSVGHRRR